MWIRVASILSLLLIGAHTAAQTSSKDALQLLDRVAARYRDAEYLHLEATRLNVIHGARRDSSDSGTFSLFFAPGGRFRYYGEDSVGSGMIVSDGTSEWRVMNSFAEYAKEPAGSFFTSRVLAASDNRSLLGARDILRSLQSMDANLHQAHFAAPVTLTLNGKAVVCQVLEFSDQDAALQQGPPFRWQMHVAVEPESLSVVRTERHVLPHLIFGNSPPPYAPAWEETTTTTFDVVDFKFKPNAESFNFAAPAGAHEVASLPTGLLGSPQPDGQSPNQKAAAEHIGKLLPDVPVLDEDGKEISLARYRGHPLLIDVWATWCVPCLSEMPILNRIRKATAASDLQMVGVDEDLHPADARDLLKRRDYDWQDYGYTSSFSRALSMNGIPLILLVDATGKIVYYHTGADDPSGLIAAISNLGPGYDVSQLK